MTDALATFDQIDADHVCLLANGQFEFARDMRDPVGATPAAILGCRDRHGVPIDYAAWEMKTGALATWRGAAALLGEDQIFAPRIEHDALRVFPGPREWLLAKRRGVVVIDPKRARWRLADQKLVVSDAAFGRRLRDALRLPEPRIFVENERGVAA